MAWEHFHVPIKAIVSKLNYSRSDTNSSTVTEKPAQLSKSTPELSSGSAASNSTTSVADEPSFTTSWSTDDTLSMITTPWTTESWTTDSSCEEDFSWTERNASSLSLIPNSSTSQGTSTVFDTLSKTTLTIYSFQEIDSESHYIHPLADKYVSGLSSTLSSWTVESFTSSGWLSDLSSEFVKANYPWSPYTEATYSETYPSSLPSSRFSFPSTITVTKKDTDLLSRLEIPNEIHTVLVT